MTDAPIVITSDMLRDALGSYGYSVPQSARVEAAKKLTKAITPKNWTVVVTDGEAPTVLFKDRQVRLEVYTGIAKAAAARRIQIAELVAEHLNERGVEV